MFLRSRPSPKKFLICGPSLSAIGGITEVMCGLLDALKAHGRTDFSYFDTFANRRFKAQGSSRITVLQMIGLIPLTVGYLKQLHTTGCRVVILNTSSFWGFWEKAWLAALAKMLRKKTVMVVHGSHFLQFTNNSRCRVFILFLLRRCDKVAFVSREMTSCFINQGIDASFIQNGARNPLDLADPSSPNKPILLKQHTPFLIASISLLEPRKRILQIIAAFKLARETAAAKGQNIRLIIAGTGPLEREISDYAEKTDGVDFIGEVRGQKKADLFRYADAIIQNSEIESFGLVSVEAMLANRLLISPPVGILEKYEDELEGAYVKSPSVGINSETIGKAVDLLAADGRLNETLARATVFAEKFAWGATVAQWIELAEAPIKQH